MTEVKEARLTPQVERALAAYDRMLLAGEEWTYDKLEKEAEVAEWSCRVAVAIRDTERRCAREQEAWMSSTVEAKLAKTVARIRNELELGYETRIRQRVKQEIEDYEIPKYLRRLTEISAVVSRLRGVMSAADFNRIVFCLHPDTDKVANAKRFEEAFHLFQSLAIRLVDLEETKRLKLIKTRGGAPLPRTAAELQAHKAAVDAARRKARLKKEAAGGLTRG